MTKLRFISTSAILLILLWSGMCRAQIDSTYNTDPIIESIENVLTVDDEISISEDLLEELEACSNGNRPNINALSYETAIRMLKLTDYQYYQLQLYIENYGQLASIYELEAIDVFSYEERKRIESLVNVIITQEKQFFFRNFFKRSKQSILIRDGQVLEHQAGYDTTRTNHYAGSPSHVCFKYNFSSQDKFFLKLSGEKDAGEQFFKGKQKYGFDFYSGSASLKGIGIVKTAVVGDYRLNFGQGLVLGNSLLSGRGSSPDNLRRFSTGIRAIAPTNEGDFLRGGAVTLGTNKLAGTLFGGRQFGSLDNVFGGDISYRRALFKIGLRLAGYSTTDTSAETISKQLKSTFQITGFNVAVDYQMIVHKHLIFGEAAINKHGKIGILQSALFNLTPTFKLATLFRYYDNEYTAPLGNAFGAKSGNSGETGLYLTSTWIAGRNMEISLYADYYRLTWPSFRTDAPTSGTDCGISAQYNISRYSKLFCKYTFRSKSQNANTNEYFKEIAETQRHKFRIQWQNEPYKFLTLKTELDWQLNHDVSSGKNRQGFLLYQDAALEFQKAGIAIHTRIAYFDTDTYDERQYAYEDDVYYAFTIGSYYYKGIRGYLVFRYKYRFLSLWLRLSQTYYIDRLQISSGLSEIDKPHKTELKFQILISF